MLSSTTSRTVHVCRTRIAQHCQCLNGKCLCGYYVLYTVYYKQLCCRSSAVNYMHCTEALCAHGPCRPYVTKRLERLRRDYQSLPSSHRTMIPRYPTHLDQGQSDTGRVLCTTNEYTYLLFSSSSPPSPFAPLPPPFLPPLTHMI